MTGGAFRLGERVEREQLPNGVRLLLLETAVHPTVELVGLLEGGLALEAPAQAGVAELTFGTLDRGTRRRSARAIADLLESNGMLLHCAVARETTLVRARCLSEDAGTMLEVLGEVLRAPTFPGAEVERVREELLVALRELEHDTFEQAYRQAAVRLLGAAHPYAREPYGEVASLTALAPEQLAAHHRQAVTGERLTLAVVGDLQDRSLRSRVREQFGALPATAPGGGASLPEEPDAPPAPPREPPLVWVPIPEREQVDLLCAGPGVARTRADFEAFGVANFILGGSYVSRLNQRLRDSEGLTYGAQSAILSGRCSGLWYANLGVSPEHVPAALAHTRQELQRAQEEGVSEEELSLAREHLIGSLAIRLETNRALAGAILEGVRLGRGVDYIDRYPERLAALTREEINRALRALLTAEPRAWVAAGTPPAGRPENPPAAAAG